VDGFVRSVDAFRSECWTGSDQNGGRHQIRTPGRLPSESAPDFVIQANGKTFYWEHLGMLDREDYSRDWRNRRGAYAAAGLADNLLTSDDLAGIRANQLASVLADLAGGTLKGRADLGFSLHHYVL
jgi:hypothetical protein